MTGAPFTLRPAVPGDLAELDALMARAYPRLLKADYPPSVLVTALPLISRAQPKLLRSGTYYVAVDASGAILGAGGWTRDRTTPELGHIRHVVTDDRQTRRGVGRAVIGHTLATARAAGLTRLDCKSTRTAEPFYAAMGFDTLGPMEVTLAPGIGFPAIRMTQAL